MGCSNSKATSADDFSTSHTKSSTIENTPQKKAVKTNQGPEKVTVKEWFDRTLAQPTEHSSEETYKQPEIPEHYIEQDISFNNETVDDAVWNKEITINHNQQNKELESGKTTWLYRKPANNKYIAPADCMTVEIEAEQGSKKRNIIAVGSLHLGNVSSSAKAAAIFTQVDVDATCAVVLLGNCFDLVGVRHFHQLPDDASKVEEELASNDEVCNAIKELADKVPVYYIRGVTDQEQLLSRSAAERLLGDKVIQVQQQNLVICAKVGNITYRVRLTPGLQWDFLNYNLPEDKLLANKPIGYYLRRASASNTTHNISRHVRALTTNIPKELQPDFINLISKSPLQERMTEIMLMHAFNVTQSDCVRKCKCVMGQGNCLSGETILQYPYLKFLLEAIGQEKLKDMLFAMAGDYSLVGKYADEDVLISALGEGASISKHKGVSAQELITVCTGGVCKRSEKMTFAKVIIPKNGTNGSVNIEDVAEKKEQKAEPQNGHVEEVKDEKKADAISIESLE